MSNKKYFFLTPKSTSLYDDDKIQQCEEIKFYQIAIFPNPKVSKYEIREVIIDNLGNILRYKLYYVGENTHRKFIKSLRDNKYRLYPVYTLNDIDFPSCGDIILAKSGMINNDSGYSGFAEFNGGKDFNWRGSVP